MHAARDRRLDADAQMRCTHSAKTASPTATAEPRGRDNADRPTIGRQTRGGPHGAQVKFSAPDRSSSVIAQSRSALGFHVYSVYMEQSGLKAKWYRPQPSRMESSTSPRRAWTCNPWRAIAQWPGNRGCNRALSATMKATRPEAALHQAQISG